MVPGMGKVGDSKESEEEEERGGDDWSLTGSSLKRGASGIKAIEDWGVASRALEIRKRREWRRKNRLSIEDDEGLGRREANKNEERAIERRICDWRGFSKNMTSMGSNKFLTEERSFCHGQAGTLGWIERCLREGKRERDVHPVALLQRPMRPTYRLLKDPKGAQESQTMTELAANQRKKRQEGRVRSWLPREGFHRRIAGKRVFQKGISNQTKSGLDLPLRRLSMRKNGSRGREKRKDTVSEGRNVFRVEREAWSIQRSFDEDNYALKNQKTMKGKKKKKKKKWREKEREIGKRGGGREYRFEQVSSSTSDAISQIRKRSNNVNRRSKREKFILSSLWEAPLIGGIDVEREPWFSPLDVAPVLKN